MSLSIKLLRDQHGKFSPQRAPTRADSRSSGSLGVWFGPTLPLTNLVRLWPRASDVHSLGLDDLSVKEMLALKFSDSVKTTQQEAEGETMIAMRRCSHRYTYFRELRVTENILVHLSTVMFISIYKPKKSPQGKDGAIHLCILPSVPVRWV